ncbi:hypothetical protein IKG24_00335 [Candidatus Saccharibacteria bacterium]|nr:hypothetical protein [Candidatus Saccharibacteria bacterium]
MESEVNTINTGELARAFESKDNTHKSNTYKRKNGPKKLALVVLFIGVAALIAGAVVLILRNISQPKAADADFLVSAGEWQQEDRPTVIWNFTEVGNGKLTTDGHLNDYDFIWSLENGKLKIETDWLYDLNDEFDYSLDQGGKILTVKNADKGIEIKFKAKERKERNAEAETNTGSEEGNANAETNTGSEENNANAEINTGSEEGNANASEN